MRDHPSYQTQAQLQQADFQALMIKQAGKARPRYPRMATHLSIDCARAAEAGNARRAQSRPSASTKGQVPNQEEMVPDLDSRRI